MRPSRRQPDELRAVTLERGVVKYAEGSCFVKFGDTHVLVTATLEDRMPPWLKGQARGWITAEYGMLPRATHERTRREATTGKQGGRTVEIQRLIGRSLRTVVDLEALGERQITIDCDVIQADGGTRTASITGAWVALHDCLNWMKNREILRTVPLRDHVAAISCGIHSGTRGARPRLCRGFVCRHRRQFRAHGNRRDRRNPGHRGEDAVHRDPAPGVAGAGAQGHRQIDRPAENGGDVNAHPPCGGRADRTTGTAFRGRTGAMPSQRHRPIAGRLVIATHNPGKLREMRELLAPYGVEAIAAGDLGLGEPEETGTNFRENAHIKAAAAAAATQRPAFADDSGLVVDALDGAPGIHSARWAGADKNFARAMGEIDDRLRGRGATTAADRTAHFISALCVAWPDGHAEEFEGRIDGVLVWPPRGEEGFGYDPMFLPAGHDRTFGEMTSEEKHGLPPGGRGLSHRARAFRKLAEACLGRP